MRRSLSGLSSCLQKTLHCTNIMCTVASVVIFVHGQLVPLPLGYPLSRLLQGIYLNFFSSLTFSNAPNPACSAVHLDFSDQAEDHGGSILFDEFSLPGSYRGSILEQSSIMWRVTSCMVVSRADNAGAGTKQGLVCLLVCSVVKGSKQVHPLQGQKGLKPAYQPPCIVRGSHAKHKPEGPDQYQSSDEI